MTQTQSVKLFLHHYVIYTRQQRLSMIHQSDYFLRLIDGPEIKNFIKIHVEGITSQGIRGIILRCYKKNYEKRNVYEKMEYLGLNTVVKDHTLKYEA